MIRRFNRIVPSRRTSLPVSVALVLAFAGLAATLSPVASAAAPAKVRCVPASSTARSSRAADHAALTSRQLRGIAQRLRERLVARAATGTSDDFGLVLRVPVHVHVLDGTQSRGPSKHRVLRQLAVLNRAYDGGQSANNTATRFTFYLASFDRTRNDTWRRATMTSAADRALRRALHVGGAADLNLYIAKPPRTDDGVDLGWSHPPWQASRHPRVDGVTINQGSMPNGALASYNLGDTAVHEIGHWLGLLHPFEGGCSEPNDLVDDTPEEGAQSDSCDPTKDTCTAPGRDPVHNFMDYAIDSCMNMFTPGQVSRMTDNWLAYRTP